jgi:Ca2+-binding RTX toxin-like protein
MSNGFLTVSWTNPGGTVDRVVWDPNNIVGGVFTGLIANPAGATLLTEDVSAVAGLPLGRIALLGRDTSALDVTGLLEDLVRTTTGDGTSENLTGDSLRDVMFGLGGNDTLNGNEANDILEGGAGADVLNGGPGSDTASYAGSPAEVTVNLVTGIGTRRCRR